MTKERRITVRGIIFKDGKLFAQKLKKETGEVPYWCTPGGGLDPGEPLLAGLHREMVEETGVAPKIGDLLFIQQYSDAEREFLEFFFHIKNPQEYHTINLEQTSHGHIEVAHCRFIDPTKEYLLPEFLQHINIESRLALKQPPLVYSYLD